MFPEISGGRKTNQEGSSSRQKLRARSNSKKANVMMMKSPYAPGFKAEGPYGMPMPATSSLKESAVLQEKLNN
jgi:hypothetical protein